MQPEYHQAITRRPGPGIVRGLRERDHGDPDPTLAHDQHEAYVSQLKACGLDVDILNADPALPDNVFVEDTAICLPDCAVLTNPGAPSRRGEVASVHEALKRYYEVIHRITAPGTLDGGDVLEVGDHYFIGLSARTNEEGADQLIQILNEFGLTGSTVTFSGFLHLKSGVSWLGEETLLLTEGFGQLPAFSSFDQIVVPDNEAYAANAVMINGRVLLAAGYPETLALVETAGFETVTLEMSEFHKVDGGLSCLSLRF